MTEPMHDAAGQPQPGIPQPSPGAQLAARRQQFGWTVEQVASQINLAPRQIEAIETDNYAALPGMAVARGFIRAYAKLLKIDAAPLMAQIGNAPSATENAIPPRRAVAAASFTPHRPATRARRSGTGKLVVGLVMVALIGAGAYVAVRNGMGAALVDRMAQHMPGAEKKGADARDSAGVASDNAASNSVVETPAAPILGETSGQASPAAVSPAVLGAQSPATTTATATAPASSPAPAAPAASLMPSPSLEAAPAPAAADKALVLNLREDSWVEIRRADNSTVVSRVMRAGSSERFDVAGPVTLVVGNARGVDVTFRGEPLSLKSGAKNNVARVRVQ